MREPSSTIAWLAENPPSDSAFTQSLAGVARRASAGEPFDLAVREPLDELALLRTAEQQARAMSEEPPLLGDARHDAYLAALGEHFALRFAIARPQWVTKPERFLDRFWFKSEVRGFRRPRSPSRRRPSGGAASSSPPAHSSAADVTREEIVEALTRVGRVLHRRGIEGEMYVVGGAASTAPASRRGAAARAGARAAAAPTSCALRAAS